MSGTTNTKGKLRSKTFQGYEKGSCGGSGRGECLYHKCKCKSGYTGQTCLAHDAYNDIKYPDSYHLLRIGQWFVVPAPFLISVLLLLASLLCVIKLRLTEIGKQRGRFRLESMGFQSITNSTRDMGRKSDSNCIRSRLFVKL